MAESFAYSQYTEVVPGIVSAVASSFVCLTVLMFPELRSLRYIELVFYISFNDLLASIGMTLGKTPDGSAACWYQGISTNFNYLSAILWSTVITFQVWLIVCKKNVIKDLTYAHVVCWGIPLLATFLPLTTNTYSNPDDESNWCFVANRSDSPGWSKLFWFIMAFYAWVWLSMLFNVLMVLGIGFRFYHMKIVPDKVRAAVRKLLLYPIIITICWSLAASVDIYSVFHPDPTSEFFFVIDGLAGLFAISQGFLNSLVFFGMNPLVRTAWVDFFVRIGCLRAAPEDVGMRDDKSVSMVSVSMNGTNSSESEASRNYRDTATNENNRRTSNGGIMARSSITSANSWYGRSESVPAAVQDEDDFIPAPNARGSQRMSLLNFLSSGDGGSGSRGATRRSLLAIVGSLSLERSPNKQGEQKQMELNLNNSTQSNPIVSVAINDFGSVMSDSLTASQSGTGTVTLSVRRAANGEYESDESSVQSGITSATGQSGGTGTRHASVNSTGTETTASTKQSGKQRTGLIGFLRR